MKTKKTFYRVVTPSTFGNQTYIKTLKDAKEWIVDFGTTRGEKVEYWKEQALLCKIEKVTEISESIEDLGECYHCDEPITTKNSSYCSIRCEEAETNIEWQLHAESGGC